MGTQSLLIGILPLLAFVIIDTFFNIKIALIVTVILALIEACWTYYTFGGFDSITLVSLFLILLLSTFSYVKKNSYYFKIQPVIISLLLGSYLLFTYFSNDPFFVKLVFKYSDLLSDDQVLILKHPSNLRILKVSSMTSGFGLILHGAVTYIAAIKLSNWWWLAVRGIGFYLFMFVSFFIAKFLN